MAFHSIHLLISKLGGVWWIDWFFISWNAILKNRFFRYAFFKVFGRRIKLLVIFLYISKNPLKPDDDELQTADDRLAVDDDRW